MEITDKTLKAIKEDPRLFEIVYKKHSKEIYAYGYYLARSQHEAEDLASMTFLKALEKIESFSGSEKQLRCWLYTICRNLFLDNVRKQKNKAVCLEVEMEEDEGISLAQTQHESIMYEMVISEINRLIPPIYAEVLLLRYKQDLEIGEIANIIKKSESNVRILIHRALNKIKACIANQDLKLNCNP